MEPEKETSSPARRPVSLLYLLGILFSSFLILRSFGKAKSNENVRKAQSLEGAFGNENNHPVGNFSLLSGPVPPYTQCNYSYHRDQHTPLRKKIYEWGVALGTIGLLVVNLFLLRSASKSANAAYMANEMTQQVFEAKIGDFGVSGISNTSVGWSMKNYGKIGAENVTWQAKLTVTELVNNTIVQTSSLSAPAFDIEAGAPPYTFSFPLTDNVGRNFDSESFKMDVAIRYDNGFGKEVSKYFCRKIIGREGTGASLNSYVDECFQAGPDENRRIQELRSKPRTR